MPVIRSASAGRVHDGRRLRRWTEAGERGSRGLGRTMASVSGSHCLTFTSYPSHCAPMCDGRWAVFLDLPDAACPRSPLESAVRGVRENQCADESYGFSLT